MATSSTNDLKNEIKGLVKTEFEKSIKSVCSEEELKKFLLFQKVILSMFQKSL